MYQVSEEYTESATSNARQVLVKALFNDETPLGGDNIINLDITEAIGTTKGLSMGNTISTQIKMTLKSPEDPIVLDGGTVAPSVSFYPLDEYCPLGKFYISEAKSANDFKTIFEISGYDAFCKTEMKYQPTIAMPNTAEAIVDDIASQCGFEVSSEIAYPSGSIDFFDWTCREYIGYIAGLSGKNAKFDRNGKLIFAWYEQTNCSVGRGLQFMGGFKRTTVSDFVVNSITSGSSGNVITSGTGIGITFENPLMTQDILDTIFSTISGASYTPAELKWRGNPAIEAGDIITVEDKDGNQRTVYVMEQTIRVSGGLYSEIKCYGDSEAAINFSTSPTSKKLQQVYNALQDAVKAATELLNGSNGGVFEIVDENEDGVNDGWVIHSGDNRQFIKANLNGIGITTDGGATYQQAMTVKGINADVVTSGQMSAQRVSVGDAALGDIFVVDMDENGHPVVTIGASGSDIKQKQTNDAISFVNGKNAQVAKFSVTGAEWEDMQEMKYCGFVWTKSAVTGNVRFTKAGD